MVALVLLKVDEDNFTSATLINCPIGISFWLPVLLIVIFSGHESFVNLTVGFLRRAIGLFYLAGGGAQKFGILTIWR